MSDSVHRWQPTRLLHPWDLPDKSTGVGYHCLPHFPGGLVVKNCLTMQKTQVQSLVQEDPICRRATKPVYHNYWACALEPGSHNYWAQVLQLLKPTHPRVHALQQEKPLQWEAHARPLESSLCSPLEKSQEQRRPSTTIFFFLKIATIKIS